MRLNNEIPTPDQVTQQAIAYWKSKIPKNLDLPPECDHVGILILNEFREIRTFYLLSAAMVSALFFSQTLVLRVAVQANASGIVLMHNKTNGQLEPSSEDILLTRNLILGARLVGMEMLDHIMIDNENHHSLRQSGCISDW